MAGGLKRGRLLVACGPRQAEAAALAWIAERVPTRTQPGPPLRVVVPSAALRAHLLARLVARQGATAGVRVETLPALAASILERAGERPRPSGEALLTILVERAAASEFALARPLADLVDAWGTVAASVRDLLDAGLDPALLDPVADAIGDTSANRAERARAHALVRVALRVQTLLDGLALAAPGETLRRAAALVGSSPVGFRAEGVLLHGWADATGGATELLTALVTAGATAIVDVPTRAGENGSGGRGSDAREESFGRPLRTALALAARREERPPSDSEDAGDAAPGLVEAPDPAAEARAAAVHVATLLAAPDAPPPERIAIVARDLRPYRSALRRHLTRLGVPFSGVAGGADGGPRTAAGRRLELLGELLARGSDAPAAAWLELLDDAAFVPAVDGGANAAVAAPTRADLRLAMAVLGVGRLGDLANLEPDQLAAGGDFALPLRDRIDGGIGDASDAVPEGGGPDIAPEDVRERTAKARRRTVAAGVLGAVVRRGRQLATGLADWPGPLPLARHIERFRSAVRDDLGWDVERMETLDAALAPLAELPSALGLERAEAVAMLRRALTETPGGRAPLGGAGAGVRVLDVTAARGMTFEHLLLVGLRRDLFPRTVREDALLPDRLRNRLADVLPDLPRKLAGHDEERHLFAQLVAAAPAVTLFWPAADDGRTLAPSPLLEALRNRPDGTRREITRAPPLHARPRPDSTSPPLTAAEAAIVAGLHGERADWAPLFAAAIAEGTAAGDATRVASARVRALDELDPDRRTPEGRQRSDRLGPYLGLVGRSEPGDPRRSEVAITTLEGIARCAWQTFLGRVLRVETQPDPLVDLPTIDRRVVGILVHRVLERLARAPGRQRVRLADISSPDAAGRVVPWPGPAELDAVVLFEAGAVLAEAGLRGEGLRRALALAAAPYLDAARVDWQLGAEILGVEVAGELLVDGRTVAFRADRVDRMAGATPGTSFLRLTDYKTGRKMDPLEKTIGRGATLQVAAYVEGAEAAGARAVGRYLQLLPKLAEADRELALDPASADLRAGFRTVAATLIEVWDEGALVPRVVQATTDQEPSACRWCRLHEACSRGDSGARLRLRRWAAGAAKPLEGTAASERAAAALWWLGVAGAGPGASVAAEPGVSTSAEETAP